MQKITNHKSKVWRRETHFIQTLKEERFVMGNEIKRWCEKFFATYNSRMGFIDAAHVVPKDASPFTKMNIQFAHKEAMEKLVGEMVGVFESVEKDEMRYKLILGLYKWIVLVPQERFKNFPDQDLGRHDRIIFQSGGTGRRSLMDILIEAMYHFEIIG